MKSKHSCCRRSKTGLVRLGGILLLACFLSWHPKVNALDVGVGVDVTQSPEGIAAEQTNSTIRVDGNHIPANGKAAILVTLLGYGGTILMNRTVELRFYNGFKPAGKAKKITNGEGIAVFSVSSTTSLTARVEVYDISGMPQVKLLEEPMIAFDGGGQAHDADIVLAGSPESAYFPWYTQIITFFLNFFAPRR